MGLESEGEAVDSRGHLVPVVGEDPGIKRAGESFAQWRLLGCVHDHNRIDHIIRNAAELFLLGGYRCSLLIAYPQLGPDDPPLRNQPGQAFFPIYQRMRIGAVHRFRQSNG